MSESYACPDARDQNVSGTDMGIWCMRTTRQQPCALAWGAAIIVCTSLNVLMSGCRDAESPVSSNTSQISPINGTNGADSTQKAAGLTRPFLLTDQADERGIKFTMHSGHQPGRYLMPETVCGGAALFDMDDDGDLDVFLIQAGDVEKRGQAASTNQLLRNRGDGTFENVTEGSGLEHRGYGMGVTTGDVDGDGDVDLYLTNFGSNVLYLNNGDGTFRDVTEQSGTGLSDSGWHTAPVFADYDGDGDLDLFVTRYLHWTHTGEKNCVNSFGTVDYCSPKAYDAPRIRNQSGYRQQLDCCLR